MSSFSVGRRGLLAGGLAAVAAGCASGGAGPAPRKQVAITIDDVPLADGPFLAGAERQSRLIDALRRAGVSEAMFFANTRRPELDPAGRLRRYAEAGHVIANHAATHPNIRDVTAEQYLADIAEADAFLRPLPGFRPWFRFPYLQEGETIEKRDAVRRGLIAMGYAQGYVTCDSIDWRTDQLCREAVADGYEIDMEAVKRLHVSHSVGACNAADRLAQAYLGRSVKQVILMHENDIEAMFIDDVVEALRRDGWGICTATEAFADPIAVELPNTLDLSEGRVAAMINATGPRDRFPSEAPTIAALDATFLREVRGARNQAPRVYPPIP